MESRFFIVDSTSPAPHLPIRPLAALQRVVLDRSLMGMGTVVPQTMWSPLTVDDRLRLMGETELQMPIFFEGADGKLGLSLEACAAGRCDGLVNGQEFTRLGQRSIINIRIMVCAFPFVVTAWSQREIIRSKMIHFFNVAVAGLQAVQMPGSDSRRNEGPSSRRYRQVRTPSRASCRCLFQGRWRLFSP